jgi:hypothetical protein
MCCLYELIEIIVNHLDVLFDDLLTILLARSLPTHNSRKTQALIIWIIQIQRLPSTILAPKKREIASILKLALDGHFDQDGKSNVISDGLEVFFFSLLHHVDTDFGLKAIHDFLRYHASHFLSPLSELLPSILPHLLSPSFEDRLHVAHALGGFVLAKIATPSSSDIHGTISRHVGSFIDAQSSKFTSTRYGARLATLLTAALAVENPSHPGHGPSWALTVLASLTVLSDSSLFSHPRSLRLIFPPLAQAQTHNHRSVRSLVPHVWKCFIWDFLRMSPEECQGEATRSSHVDSPINFEERAFLVVKQELRGGIGVALVNSLLEQSEALGHSAPRFGGDRTARALTVVKDMVCSEDKATHDQGLSLLTRLVGAIGSPCITIPKQATWNCNKILAQSLFDGTILNTRWKDLSAAVHTIHDCETDEVRQLSEQEIVQHWDALTSIWIKCVEESLQGTSFQLSVSYLQHFTHDFHIDINIDPD